MCWRWSNADLSVNNQRCPTCHAIALGHQRSHATLSSSQPMPERFLQLLCSPPNSSCLILAPWRSLKFMFHYSLFNTHYCLVRHTSTCYIPSLQGNWRSLYLSHHLPPGSVPLPPPSPPPWPSYPCCLSLPHLVTTNLYTIITARCIHLSLYLACRQLVEWLRDLQAWKVS